MKQIGKYFLEFSLLGLLMVSLATKAEHFAPQDSSDQLSEYDTREDAIKPNAFDDQLLTESEEQDTKSLLNLLRMRLLLSDVPRRRSFSKRGKTYVRLINKKGGYYNRPCLVNVMSCYFFGLN